MQSPLCYPKRDRAVLAWLLLLSCIYSASSSQAAQAHPTSIEQDSSIMTERESAKKEIQAVLLAEAPLPLQVLPLQVLPLQGGKEVDALELKRPLLPQLDAAAISRIPQPDIFIVGLDLGARTAESVVEVKGIEAQPEQMAQWLLPLQDVLEALEFSTNELDNGDLELRSPALVTHLSTSSLKNDPDLGLAISIAEIEQRFGIPAQFDTENYTIRFDPPWLNQSLKPGPKKSPSSPPVSLQGLPGINAPLLGLSGLSQKLTISGGDVSTTDRGSLTGFGSALGGSVYGRIEQRDLQDSSTWQLQELQYLRQTPSQDFVIGSQPSFWRNHTESKDYWGLTAVRRWGFEPRLPSGSGFNPQQRLQASLISRRVTGEAAPGTLVRLTQNNGSRLIDEQLVNSSGAYRFEALPLQGGRGQYQVQLYENGQLTATPEIKVARFSSLPGQLSQGSSALILSGGALQSQEGGLMPGFQELQGGLSYRHGLSESLTLGMGVVQAESLSGLLEAVYLPSAVPLQASVSALVDSADGAVDVDADLRLQPFNNLKLRLASDRLSQRFQADWRVSPNLTLLTKGSSRDEAIAGGARFSLGQGASHLRGDLTLDTQSRLRWNLRSRLGVFSLQNRGDEVTTRSELRYQFSGQASQRQGHALSLKYDSRNLNGFDHLTTASWHYQDPAQQALGRSRFDVSLGYGIGSTGQGFIASTTIPLFPGLDLRARYQGISTSSDRDSFRIELQPRLNLQQNISLADRRQEKLRSQGGLILQPFLDQNGNGIQDEDESLYTDNLDLLFSLNNKSISSSSLTLKSSGAFIALSPQTYRLDLNPEGYPLDWRPQESAYAVEVVPGQYTPVALPLLPSYSRSGQLTSSTGEVLAGQRITATHSASGAQVTSITNGAGIFYLENLALGEHRLEVSAHPPLEQSVIRLTTESELYESIDLKVAAEGQSISFTE